MSARLTEAFRRVRRRVAYRAATDVLVPVAEAIAQKIRDRLPVESGDTRETVRVVVHRPGARSVRVDVVVGGPDSPIVFIEYGTLHQDPNPVIHDVARESHAEAERAIAQRLSQLIAAELRAEEVT